MSLNRAVVGRKWDELRTYLAPDLVVTDHRPLGWETLRGPTAYIETLKSLVELAPDVRLRNDHIIMSHRTGFIVSTWIGTREGGAFEAPRIVVSAFDADDRARSFDFYGLEQADVARAKYEELASPPQGARAEQE